MSVQSTETEMFLNLDEQKRQRILDAAVDEFAHKSYDNASMNVVVEKAGISKGALFKYFTSKAGLFAYVYSISLGRIKDYLRAVRDKSEDEDFFLRLEKVMQAGVHFTRTHPGLARIYYRIIFTGDSPYKREILTEIHRESLEFIQSLIRKGIDRGELRPDLDPEAAAFVVESVVDRFVQSHNVQYMEPPLYAGYTQPGDSKQRSIEIVELLRKGMAF